MVDRQNSVFDAVVHTMAVQLLVIVQLGSFAVWLKSNLYKHICHFSPKVV